MLKMDEKKQETGKIEKDMCSKKTKHIRCEKFTLFA